MKMVMMVAVPKAESVVARSDAAATDDNNNNGNNNDDDNNNNNNNNNDNYNDNDNNNNINYYVADCFRVLWLANSRSVRSRTDLQLLITCQNIK